MFKTLWKVGTLKEMQYSITTHTNSNILSCYTLLCQCPFTHLNLRKFWLIKIVVIRSAPLCFLPVVKVKSFDSHLDFQKSMACSLWRTLLSPQSVPGNVISLALVWHMLGLVGLWHQTLEQNTSVSEDEVIYCEKKIPK